ncbi:transposase [Streptomyces sp. NRRL S-1824]|uniref:transposase n=1 Tax=Streptomyces sp. NRRL S-1824 TaxID=1463889 RepID=UPI00131B3132
MRTGCAWRQLPKDFAPWPTVYWYFTWWHGDGAVERIHDALRGQIRKADGRNAEPSAGLIDSQSVRTVDTVPATTRGFDVGKKVKGPQAVHCHRHPPRPPRRSSAFSPAPFGGLQHRAGAR